MAKWKKSAHVVYQCSYHLVWTPKYRYRILQIEGKVMLTGNYGAPVMVTGGNSSSSSIDGTVSNPAVNAERSISIQQPVGSADDTIREKSSKGELVINVDYTSQ